MTGHEAIFQALGNCIDQAKDDGWKIRKVAGEWEHTCPDEAAEERKDSGNDYTVYL